MIHNIVQSYDNTNIFVTSQLIICNDMALLLMIVESLLRLCKQIVTEQSWWSLEKS
jgi:hypothetical protein